MERVKQAFERAALQSQNVLEQVRFLLYELTAFCSDNPFAYKCLLETIPVDEKSRIENSWVEQIYQVGEALMKLCVEFMEQGVAQGVFKENLQAQPTALIFQFHIFSVVLVANNKKEYIENTMMSKEKFVKYAMEQLMHSILKDGVEFSL